MNSAVACCFGSCSHPVPVTSQKLIRPYSLGTIHNFQHFTSILSTESTLFTYPFPSPQKCTLFIFQNCTILSFYVISSPTVQHTFTIFIYIHTCINILNSFSLHLQFQFDKFNEISQSCAKHVFYIGFVSCTGNLCLLCWYYA